jgi:hypothetical protein
MRTTTIEMLKNNRLIFLINQSGNSKCKEEIHEYRLITRFQTMDINYRFPGLVQAFAAGFFPIW